MPQITDWLMVVITFVYVVATALICYANFKSAKASKAQLEEMQKQYDEENRPYITTEVIYEKRAFYGLRFTNHGKRIANHVTIDLEDSFINCLKDSHKQMLRKQKGKSCIIGIGQHYDMFIGSNELRRKEDLPLARGTISYESQGKKYHEEFTIDLKNYMTFFSVYSYDEDILNAIKQQNNELRKISNIMEYYVDNQKADEVDFNEKDQENI